jgi:ATP-binding cassette, subfamily B, bacterial PglK
MNSIRKAYSLFSRSDRTKLGFLVLLMVLGGILEAIGIGLLFPYVSILQDSQKIFENRYLNIIFQSFGFHSARSFGIAMSVILLLVFLTKGLFTLAINNLQLRFINTMQLELGKRLFAGYLYRPYSFFLTANTSTLIGNLTTSLGQFCGGVIQSALTMTAEIAVAAGLIVFLVYVSPAVSWLALLFVSTLSGLFIKVMKTRIARYAIENDARWKAMIRVVNEGISSVKEVQVLGREQFFVDSYHREYRHYATAVRRYSVLSQLPRIVLETAAVAGMIFLALFALLSGSFERELFPVLAVFAVATFRIVPSANRILQSWNAIGFYSPAIDVIARGLGDAPVASNSHRDLKNEYQFRQSLVVSIKSFAYHANDNFHLCDVHVKIGQGQKVAFIGHSGSGKTTLVDLILGLFPQFEGEITVDGCDIRQDIMAWRRCIGYIPQHIYLRDASIKSNVALGVSDQDIDINQVQRAVSLAGLDGIINAQPAGLDTIVGDRGVRLSGGERQRIGIARALYHDPDLLVLDEATSALDNQTERRIIDAILGLSPAKTIIVIAHRLTTVKDCDCVYLMKGGRIIDQGRFDDLAERHPDFVNPQSQVI